MRKSRLVIVSVFSFFIILIQNFIFTQENVAYNTGLRYPFPEIYPITSEFGNRIHPISGRLRHHDGIDIGAPLRTQVLAVRSGTVARAEQLSGYGNVIDLRHNNPPQITRYAHLASFNVRRGQVIEQGNVIGHVGDTGNVTGPHLHFELIEPNSRNHWIAVNPRNRLGAPISPSIPEPERFEPIPVIIPDCDVALFGECIEPPSCNLTLFGDCI